MEVAEYQIAARRTRNPRVVGPNALLEASMGLSDESGEVAGLVKKWYFHEHELDQEALAYEIGDVLWYCVEAADWLGYGLNEIMDMNIEKLDERYENGFSTEDSINRRGP